MSALPDMQVGRPVGGVSRFCMLSPADLSWTLWTQPMHDLLSLPSSGSCTKNWLDNINMWVKSLVVMRGLVSSEAVIIEYRFFRYSWSWWLQSWLVPEVRDMHRDMALCYHQLFAPQLVRVYRPYACVCRDVHRSHLLLWLPTPGLMCDWHTIYFVLFLQHIFCLLSYFCDS